MKFSEAEILLAFPNFTLEEREALKEYVRDPDRIRNYLLAQKEAGNKDNEK